MSRFWYTACLAAMLVACSDPAADDGFLWANHGSCSPKPVSLSAARRDSLPAYPLGLPLNYDERFYRAAQHTPGGFAGFYLGDPVNGRQPTVLLFVDTTHVLADLDSLALYYPGSHPSFARDSVQLRLVRWNWVQLYEWYYYVLLVAGLPRGLTVTDIQEFNNRVEFGRNRRLLARWCCSVSTSSTCRAGSQRSV